MRAIYQIAKEIKQTWTKPSPYALPYLNAMLHLSDKNSNYGCDDASSVVLYFLSNASTFKGEDARRLKAELKEVIK